MKISGPYEVLKDNTNWGKYISCSKAFQEERTSEKGRKLKISHWSCCPMHPCACDNSGYFPIRPCVW